RGAGGRLWIDAIPREPPLRRQSGRPDDVCRRSGGHWTGGVGGELHPRVARRGGGSEPGAAARIGRAAARRTGAAAALPVGGRQGRLPQSGEAIGTSPHYLG